MNVGLVALIVLVTVHTVASDMVLTTYGYVRGRSARSRSGRWFQMYYGIPYALPPVGNLRLKAPVEPNSWTGIKDCFLIPPKCAQPEDMCSINSTMVGQEDCLYLNVFTPKKSNTNMRWPVIVYVHGGAFHVGEGATYGPEFFLDENVILVTINYRLGALGFLATGDGVIPGNYGLKDQVQALNWVKMNIGAFGGNPNSITLMGHSAGAASVHLHLFSPLSKGLFNKVIMQSGNAHSTWAYYDPPRTREQGWKFANLTGCYHKDSVKTLECIQAMPVEEIIRRQNDLYVWNCNPVVLYRAAIENNVTGAFLPHKPGPHTYMTVNIPWLTGITSSDAAVLILPFLLNNGTLAKEINADYYTYLPLICEYLYTVRPQRLNEITERIKQYYFGEQDIGTETDIEFVSMMTDILFMVPMVKSILYNRAKRFVYLFDHHGSFSFQNEANYTKYLGVSHSDELPMLFFFPKIARNFNQQDLNVSHRMIRHWAMFAKYGNPNGNLLAEKKWKATASNKVELLRIRSEEDVMTRNLFRDRYKFWSDLQLGR